MSVETEKIIEAINQQTLTLRKLIDDNNLEIRSLRTEINRINESQLQARKEIVLLKEENEKLKTENETKNDRIKRIEREMRAKNAVINGILEDNDEMDLNESIRQIIIDKLEIDCKKEDIESVRRIGIKGQYSRPIHVKFQNESVRNNIMKNKKKLKGSNIYIDEDYTQEIREERKILREVLKKEKQEGKNAYIKYNKLISNKEVYTIKDVDCKTMELKNNKVKHKKIESFTNKRDRSEEEDGNKSSDEREENKTLVNKQKNKKKAIEQASIRTFLSGESIRKNSI